MSFYTSLSGLKGAQAELGTVDEVFYQSRHPYTLGLLASRWLDIAAGGAIALVAALAYGAAWLLSSLRRPARLPSGADVQRSAPNRATIEARRP